MCHKTFDDQSQSDALGHDQVRQTAIPTDAAPQADPQSGHDRNGRGHALMMLLMCAPMVVVVTLLVVSGAAGAGSFVVVIACMAMMALMMRGMGHGSGDR